jgi:hypothetical protein
MSNFRPPEASVPLCPRAGRLHEGHGFALRPPNSLTLYHPDTTDVRERPSTEFTALNRLRWVRARERRLDASALNTSSPTEPFILL